MITLNFYKILLLLNVYNNNYIISKLSANIFFFIEKENIMDWNEIVDYQYIISKLCNLII